MHRIFKLALGIGLIVIAVLASITHFVVQTRAETFEATAIDTSARVIAKHTADKGGRRGAAGREALTIDYQYRTQVGAVMTGNRRLAQDQFNALRTGMHVAVRYDPYSPGRHRLADYQAPSMPLYPFGITFAFSIVAFLIGVVLLGRCWASGPPATVSRLRKIDGGTAAPGKVEVAASAAPAVVVPAGRGDFRNPSGRVVANTGFGARNQG